MAFALLIIVFALFHDYSFIIYLLLNFFEYTMNISINTFDPHSVVNIIAKKFKVKVKYKGAESSLDVPKRMGTGFIKGINFSEGIGLLILKATFNRDLVLNYGDKLQPLRCLFCQQGRIIHILDPDNFRYNLLPSEGSIAASTDANPQVIMIPAQTLIGFTMLEIDKENFHEKIKDELSTVPEKFANIFNDVKNEQHFLYQGFYSLVIAEILNDIQFNPHAGFVRKVFIESKALELLSMQIKQYQDDLKVPSQRQILRKEEIDLILKAKKIIEDNFKSPPSIKELARILGTNENKLSKGFKKIFHKTIKEVVLETRLKQAKLMIANNNSDSLKQISYMIGYKNPSSFSKRFKEKYGVLPKYFLEKYRQKNEFDDMN